MNLSKLFGCWLLVVGCWLFTKPVAAQNYTREVPQVIECTTCTSNAQFEWHAANAVPINNIRHVMVFNTSTQQLNTYFVSKIYERELGFALEEVYHLPNLEQHTDAFNAFIATSGNSDPIELEYPKDRGTAPGTLFEELQQYGAWARGVPEVNQALASKIPNPFVLNKFQLVSIKFDNQWTLVMLINPIISAEHIFVALFNEKGEKVQTSVGNSSSGGGSAGGSVSNGGMQISVSGGGGGKTATICTKHNDGPTICVKIPV